MFSKLCHISYIFPNKYGTLLKIDVFFFNIPDAKENKEIIFYFLRFSFFLFSQCRDKTVNKKNNPLTDPLG